MKKKLIFLFFISFIILSQTVSANVDKDLLNEINELKKQNTQQDIKLNKILELLETAQSDRKKQVKEYNKQMAEYEKKRKEAIEFNQKQLAEYEEYKNKEIREYNERVEAYKRLKEESDQEYENKIKAYEKRQEQKRKQQAEFMKTLKHLNDKE